MGILVDYGVAAIRALYKNSKASFDINGELSSWLDIAIGVSQGYVV